MKVDQFNLVTDPWIKVMDLDGNIFTVSMRDLFLNCQNYQRLAGDMETQDLAVLRLLLSVLTTVYSRVDEEDETYDWLKLDSNYQIVEIEEDSSEDVFEYFEDTWHNLFQLQKFSKAPIDYLNKNIESFNFFGENPFYQVNKSVYDSEVPSNKKINVDKPKGIVDVKQINRTISESNNSPAIFAPKSLMTRNDLTLDELIRWIITYQSFTGVTDKTKVTTKDKFSVSAGWIYGLNPVFASGKNLFQTLMLNLNFENQKSEYVVEKPVWEFESSKDYIDFIKSIPTVSSLSVSTIYTLWSRMLHLEWIDDKVIIFTAGLPKLDNSNAFSEPMTSWRHNRKDGNFYPATKQLQNFNTAMWRNFGQYVPTTKEPDVDYHEPGLISWLKRMFDTEALPTRSDLILKTANLISDGNATSQSPVVENVDSFQIRAEVLFDKNEDNSQYWPKNIEDMIVLTQQVGRDFWIFANSINKLRGLEDTSFANKESAKFYESLNRPFLIWLSSLRNDQERSEKREEWRVSLRQLALTCAEDLMTTASPRDIIGRIDDDKNLVNIFTIFNRYKYNVLRKLN